MKERLCFALVLTVLCGLVIGKGHNLNNRNNRNNNRIDASVENKRDVNAATSVFVGSASDAGQLTIPEYLAANRIVASDRGKKIDAATGEYGKLEPGQWNVFVVVIDTEATVLTIKLFTQEHVDASLMARAEISSVSDTTFDCVAVKEHDGSGYGYGGGYHGGKGKGREYECVYIADHGKSLKGEYMIVIGASSEIYQRQSDWPKGFYEAWLEFNWCDWDLTDETYTHWMPADYKQEHSVTEWATEMKVYFECVDSDDPHKCGDYLGGCCDESTKYGHTKLAVYGKRANELQVPACTSEIKKCDYTSDGATVYCAECFFSRDTGGEITPNQLYTPELFIIVFEEPWHGYSDPNGDLYIYTTVAHLDIPCESCKKPYYPDRPDYYPTERPEYPEYPDRPTDYPEYPDGEYPSPAEYPDRPAVYPTERPYRPGYPTEEPGYPEYPTDRPDYGHDLCYGVLCYPLNQCHNAGYCDPYTGKCSNPKRPDGSYCDDYDMTTKDDKCYDGVCVGTDKCYGVYCDDVCKKCDKETGYCTVPANDGYECDDYNPYTADDKCYGGYCIGVNRCSHVDCSIDHYQCIKSGQCNYLTGECEYVLWEDGYACDDYDDYTVNDKCYDGLCNGHDYCSSVYCDSPPSQCHGPGVCDVYTGKCLYESLSYEPCDDYDPYTYDDTCYLGECIGVDYCYGITCYPPGQCYARGECDPYTGKCSHDLLPDGTPCDDYNDYTYYDECVYGECKGTDFCLGVYCTPESQCHLAGECINHMTGECRSIVAPDGTPCDDGNYKTVYDECQYGICKGSDKCDGVYCYSYDQCYDAGYCDKYTGKCTDGPMSPDGTECDDGDPYTFYDACYYGICKGQDLCEYTVCAASDQCHLPGICDPYTGQCSNPKYKDGKRCDDYNPYTYDDRCYDGICKGKNLCKDVVCYAYDQCKYPGECDPYTGYCSNPPKEDGTYCDDGDDYTVHDKCYYGECIGENLCAYKDCKSYDQCHSDGICDPYTGECKYTPKPDGTYCDDNDYYTKNDNCMYGVCIGTPKCDDVYCDSCTTCNPYTGYCDLPVDEPYPCDDGDPYTYDDTCYGGKCIGLNRCAGVDCSKPPQQCLSNGYCDYKTGYCVYDPQPDGTYCDDYNDRTVQDQCYDGICGGKDLCSYADCTRPPSDCYGSGYCDPYTGQCKYEELTGTYCDDYDMYTVHDQCYKGECVGVNLCAYKDCPPLNECHKEGSCDPYSGKCNYEWVENGQPCDDGNYYTNSYCEYGECIGEDPCSGIYCYAIDQCHEVGYCDPYTGYCSNPQKPDYYPCDDNDYYTKHDVCIDGYCKGVDNCDDIYCSECQHCDPYSGECVAVYEYAPCDDYDPYTVDDTCIYGECVGVNLCEEVDCSYPPHQCLTNGYCDYSTGYCKYENKPDHYPCDDYVPHTTSDMCQYGVCNGVDLCKDVYCDQPPNQCYGPGSCDIYTGLCEYECLHNVPCDDYDPYTYGDICYSGVCRGINYCENVYCAALDVCHEPGVCNPQNGECSYPYSQDGKECDDYDPYTFNDKCYDGVCRGQNLCEHVECYAKDDCHKAGYCDPYTGKCSVVPLPDGYPCDDYNAQTSYDVCKNGVCNGVDLCYSADCRTPPDACHYEGYCDPEYGYCNYPDAPDYTPCDDYDPYTTNDHCYKGECIGESSSCYGADSKDCQCRVPNRDGNICEAYGSSWRCVETGYVADGTKCDDYDPSTHYDHCVYGICQGIETKCYSPSGPLKTSIGRTLHNDPHSIAAWVTFPYDSKPSKREYILHLGGYENGNEMWTIGGYKDFQYGSTGYTNQQITSGYSFPPAYGAPNLCTSVWDGEYYSLYIDDELIGKQKYDNPYDISTDDLYIGMGRDGDNDFSGTIHGVCVYWDALDQYSVKNLKDLDYPCPKCPKAIGTDHTCAVDSYGNEHEYFNDCDYHNDICHNPYLQPNECSYRPYGDDDIDTNVRISFTYVAIGGGVLLSSVGAVWLFLRRRRKGYAKVRTVIGEIAS